MNDLLGLLIAHTTDPDALVVLFIAATLPFGLDPFTNIVNVHWATGLAVIFGEEDTDAPPFKPPLRTHELSGNGIVSASRHE
jgi:hypothetical protein